MPAHHVSLAFQELTFVDTELLGGIVAKVGAVYELDLSNNDLSSLVGLETLAGTLQILVADHNKIDGAAKLPQLPHLHTLSLNSNSIKNLSTFLPKVRTAFPQLRHLSLLNNEACPSYFNGGTAQQHADYRHYTVAFLPNLKFLDSSEIDEAERRLARRVYGDAAATSKSTSGVATLPASPARKADGEAPPQAERRESRAEADGDGDGDGERRRRRKERKERRERKERKAGGRRRRRRGDGGDGDEGEAAEAADAGEPARKESGTARVDDWVAQVPVDGGAGEAGRAAAGSDAEAEAEAEAKAAEAAEVVPAAVPEPSRAANPMDAVVRAMQAQQQQKAASREVTEGKPAPPTLPSPVDLGKRAPAAAPGAAWDSDGFTSSDDSWTSSDDE